MRCISNDKAFTNVRRQAIRNHFANWQVDDAKLPLAEIVRLARSEGAQILIDRGVSVAVVLSMDDFERLSAKKPSFVQFVQASPLVGANLKIQRNKAPVRRTRF